MAVLAVAPLQAAAQAAVGNGPKTTLLTQTGMLPLTNCRTLTPQYQRQHMIDLNWMTHLVSRTIGANRGRAARGSPQA